MAPPIEPAVKAIFILTYVSLALSLMIFVLSMLDFGIPSGLTNLILPFLTVIYHTVILLTHRRHRTRVSNDTRRKYHRYPTATTASLVCVYLLGFAWIVPCVFLLGGGVMIGDYPNPRLFAGNKRTLAMQFAFDTSEVGVMFSIAAISTSLRRAVQWESIPETYAISECRIMSKVLTSV
jgi:hypothetical protein